MRQVCYTPCLMDTDIKEPDWKQLFLECAELLQDYQWHHEEDGNYCYECGANAKGSAIPTHKDNCKTLKLLIIKDTTLALDELKDEQSNL